MSPEAPISVPRLAYPVPPWYVCMTKPRQERLAEKNLRDQDYEVYLPELRRWKKAGGQWVSHDEVMFPRYTFVRPGRPEQSIAPVRSTPGITKLVSFGTVLGCLAPDRMDALRHLVDSHRQAAPAQPLTVGMTVMFTEGPLKGYSGLVSDVASERVMVMMTLLGQERRVTAAVNLLKAA